MIDIDRIHRLEAEGHEFRYMLAPSKISTDTPDVQLADGQVGGTAIVWSAPSSPIGGEFIEHFLPGAFADSLRQEDVLLLAHHDHTEALARMSRGTLVIEDQPDALYFKAHVDHTTFGRDLLANVRNGDVRGVSFSFAVTGDPDDESWEYDEDGVLHRYISRAMLFEISPVTWPAYPQSRIVAGPRQSKAREQQRELSRKLRREIEQLEWDRFNDPARVWQRQELARIQSDLAILRMADKPGIRGRLGELLSR